MRIRVFFHIDDRRAGSAFAVLFAATLVFAFPPAGRAGEKAEPAVAEAKAETAAPAAPAATAEVEPAPDRSVSRIAEQVARMIPRHEFQRALDNIAEGLEKDPVYIPLWRLKAAAENALRRFDDAEESLAVCLLKDPLDIEANILSLVNAIDRPDLSDREKTLRIAETLDPSREEFMGELLASFMKRRNFLDYLAPILSGWRKSATVLEPARQILYLYSGAKFAVASSVFSSIDAKRLPDGLGDAIALLLRNNSADRRDLWAVEVGKLESENGVMTLTAQPGGQAFSRLRLSVDWRNVYARLAAESRPGENRSIYLRFTGSDSFLRVSLEGSMLFVQERVPQFGLANIFELPIASFGGNDLEMVLRGERLTLLSGGVPLSEAPLPVTGVLRSGRVAIGSINRGMTAADARISRFAAERMDDRWEIVDPRIPKPELAELLRSRELTGFLIPVNTAGDASLPALTLAAGNAGVANYAVLPAGSADLDLIRLPFAKLPKALADNIWSGVVVRPNSDAPNWDAVDACLRAASATGLESVLFLTAADARSLSSRIGSGKPAVQADWLLLAETENLSPATVSNLSRIYSNSLQNCQNSPRIFCR